MAITIDEQQSTNRSGILNQACLVLLINKFLLFIHR